MKVCAVTLNSINEVWQNKLDEIGETDFLLFGFNGLGLVSYKKELSQESEYFQDVAKLSKQTASVVISGCDTDNYGLFRHSAVIADSGKLLGVSDMLYSIDGSEYSPGGNLRVYQTSKGRVGIIIGEDLFFSDVVDTLSLCDAELIVCLFKSIDNYITETVVKSHAFCNGINIILLSKEKFFYCDANGEVKLSSRQNVVKTDLNFEKEYHLLSVRKRCLKRESK